MERYDAAVAAEQDGKFDQDQGLYNSIIRNWADTEAAELAEQQLVGLLERDRKYREEQKQRRLERLGGAAAAGEWLAQEAEQDQAEGVTAEEAVRRQRDRVREAVAAARETASDQ